MSEREERKLVARLREGDEAAFGELIERYHGPLRRLARTFVSSDAAAEEVVQDTWVAVLDGLAGFEERASVKTWHLLDLAIRELPERQRQVVVLRDALGWTAEDVCNVLELEETNQRVLLHRARSRLRESLEKYEAKR